MPEQIELSFSLPTDPATIYSAWLDSEKHADFTGSEASVDPKVGGEFTAWDGYIWGTSLELTPFTRIVQAWRTTEFPEDAPDSRLEILLEPAEEGTLITLIHSNIPDGQSDAYRSGWIDYYLDPMKEYFGAAE